MTAPHPIAIFSACAEKYALACAFGEMEIHEAVDRLQAYAERSGLISDLGPDTCQDIMAAAFVWASFEAEAGEIEDAAQDYAAHLVQQWELEDRRDSWKRTGERPPSAEFRNGDISGKPENKPRRRGPAQSTVAAFRFVLSLGDAEYLERWLQDHSDVAPALLEQLQEAA